VAYGAPEPPRKRLRSADATATASAERRQPGDDRPAVALLGAKLHLLAGLEVLQELAVGDRVPFVIAGIAMFGISA